MGSDSIWAYVESMGFGPEEAGKRAWNVYSYSSGSWEEQTGVAIEDMDPPEPQSIRPQAPAEPPSLPLAFVDPFVDPESSRLMSETELQIFLTSHAAVKYGAGQLRVSGVQLHRDGVSEAYQDINGVYRRSDFVRNGRAVYLHTDMPTALWWDNIDGKISWCVGPKNLVASDSIWAHVESMGFGPEEAGTRTWNVYSYNSGSWEEQTGVEVENLDSPAGVVSQSRSGTPRPVRLTELEKYAEQVLRKHILSFPRKRRVPQGAARKLTFQGKLTFQDSLPSVNEDGTSLLGVDFAIRSATTLVLVSGIVVHGASKPYMVYIQYIYIRNHTWYIYIYIFSRLRRLIALVGFVSRLSSVSS